MSCSNPLFQARPKQSGAKRRRKAPVEVRRPAVGATFMPSAHESGNIPARRDHRGGAIAKETSK
jgi:hypothetical protein